MKNRVLLRSVACPVAVRRGRGGEDFRFGISDLISRSPFLFDRLSALSLYPYPPRCAPGAAGAQRFLMESQFS
jgi:hypothetical protein